MYMHNIISVCNRFSDYKIIHALAFKLPYATSRGNVGSYLSDKTLVII